VTIVATAEAAAIASHYCHRKTIVVGAAHGIGSRVTELLVDAGAEVHTVDIDAPPVPDTCHRTVDLRDLDATAAVYRDLPDGVSAGFYCAGVMGVAGPTDVMRINFLAYRMLVDELEGRMAPDAALVSTAGRTAFEIGTRHIATRLDELLSITDYRAADEWCDQRIANAAIYDGSPGRAAFKFSKAALVRYTQQRSYSLLQRGVRINVTCPALNESSGYVRTPTADLAPTARPNAVYHDRSIEHISTLEQQATPLLFLNSTAASAISGACLPVDFGETASCITGQITAPNLGLPGRYGALAPYSED
jgi:NAD(P)-dependent dehydrogenase (short-subunit alcohol dehydrogenase family)